MGQMAVFRKNSTSKLWLRALSALVVAYMAIATTATARLEQAKKPHPNGDEIIVFEVKDCTYCRLFRRDVLPGYRLSRRGKVVPIRFLDARLPMSKVAGLKEPLSQVPTVVIFRRGQEIGRIAGYTGPTAFYSFLNLTLGRSF